MFALLPDYGPIITSILGISSVQWPASVAHAYTCEFESNIWYESHINVRYIYQWIDGIIVVSMKTSSLFQRPIIGLPSGRA